MLGLRFLLGGVIIKKDSEQLIEREAIRSEEGGEKSVNEHVFKQKTNQRINESDVVLLFYCFFWRVLILANRQNVSQKVNTRDVTQSIAVILCPFSSRLPTRFFLVAAGA